MVPRPPRSTRTATLFPYPAPFRSPVRHGGGGLHCRAVRKSAQRTMLGLGLVRRLPDFVAGGKIGRRNASQASSGPSGHCRKCHVFHTRAIQHSAVACRRSEEHTSELQSLMRISYAVFCLKKKKK